MNRYCQICAEPLQETVPPQSSLCVLCRHRTTAFERIVRRPQLAGVIDSA